jgi:hypothetical protein
MQTDVELPGILNGMHGIFLSGFVSVDKKYRIGFPYRNLIPPEAVGHRGHTAVAFHQHVFDQIQLERINHGSFDRYLCIDG